MTLASRSMPGYLGLGGDLRLPFDVGTAGFEDPHRRTLEGEDARVANSSGDGC
jgi:hypothetical protein